MERQDPAGRVDRQNRVRVLFLGGSGRSGTTLVERLLGELPGVCALGEVVHLWQRGLGDDERCGCGERFHACSFWGKVGVVAFDGWHNVDAARVLTLKAAVDRNRFIPALALPALPAGLRRKVMEYTDYYVRLYAAACQVSGADVVVDSSKHASLAFTLRWRDDLDLRVVHVVRDSRAVAYSWTKRVPRPEADPDSHAAYMDRFSPTGAALLWDVMNGGFDLLAARGIPRRLVRYEDFMAAPVAGLVELGRYAGVVPDADALAFLTDHAAELRPSHTVAGNPMRFHTGTVQLRRDDAWRTRMPVLQRAAVSALTWPLLTRYGYRGRQGLAPTRGVI